MRIQPQRQSGGLLFLHRGSFLLFGRGAGGFFFLLPRSVFRLRGVWRHIFPSPGSFPPSPPLKLPNWQVKGGKDTGGRKNMPPDSLPTGAVNSSRVTAVQSLADVSSSVITTLQNVHDLQCSSLMRSQQTPPAPACGIATVTLRRISPDVSETM